MADTTGAPFVRAASLTIRLQPPGAADLHAYLASPAKPGPHPGVLVVHDLGGLNHRIRALARQWAMAGYVALAVDLFTHVHPALCVPRAIAGVVVRPLRNGFLRDLTRALAVLQARPDVDAGRVGVVGYSMGAAYALQLACVAPGLRVVGAYCGQLPRPLNALQRACPILGVYAGRDLTTTGVAGRLERALQAYGVPHLVTSYARTRHEFLHPDSPSYDAPAAADAWAQSLAFFGAYLGRASLPCPRRGS